MWYYFEEKPVPHNTRDGSKLVLPNTKSLPYGINSLEGVFYGIIYVCPLKTVKV